VTLVEAMDQARGLKERSQLAQQVMAFTCYDSSWRGLYAASSPWSYSKSHTRGLWPLSC
jgi:hypothetical protein